MSKLFRLLTAFSGEVAKHWYVIVETYDHKNYGKGKRSYLSQFTEAERKTISEWYPKLYGWYLRTGCPEQIIMSIKTYDLLNQAANFFASI